MCGIFVYYNYKPVEFDPEETLALMSHRGPDINGESKVVERTSYTHVLQYRMSYRFLNSQ